MTLGLRMVDKLRESFALNWLDCELWLWGHSWRVLLLLRELLVRQELLASGVLLRCWVLLAWELLSRRELTVGRVLGLQPVDKLRERARLAPDKLAGVGFARETEFARLSDLEVASCNSKLYNGEVLKGKMLSSTKLE